MARLAYRGTSQDCGGDMRSAVRSTIVDTALRHIAISGVSMEDAALRAGFNKTYVRTLKCRKNSTLANLERLLAAHGLELRVVRRQEVV